MLARTADSDRRRTELVLFGVIFVRTAGRPIWMYSPFLFVLVSNLRPGAAVHFDGDLGAVDRLALVVGDDALDHAG